MFTIFSFITSVVGILSVLFFFWVMFGVQKTTLFSKKWSFGKWHLDVNSTKGKELNIKVEKK